LLISYKFSDVSERIDNNNNNMDSLMSLTTSSQVKPTKKRKLVKTSNETEEVQNSSEMKKKSKKSCSNKKKQKEPPPPCSCPSEGVSHEKRPFPLTKSSGKARQSSIESSLDFWETIFADRRARNDLLCSFGILKEVFF